MSETTGTDVYVVDACRTPMGKIGGSLSAVRPDDLAALVVAALLERSPGLDPADVADVVWGSANQSGEDNRNVGRMAAMLAGLPVEVPGVTVNRLCGSGMQAVIGASQAMKDGWGDVMVAGGSESMSRAPWVMMKPERGFAVGTPKMADTTLGWRLVNPRMAAAYPPLALGETAEEVAAQYKVDRDAQDAFALESHRNAVAAATGGRFDAELVPVTVPGKRDGDALVSRDEGPRPDTSADALARLQPAFRSGGTVTAGNSSPMSDGAAAVLLATDAGLERRDLRPVARIVASAAAGVHPSVMGIGPVPATRTAIERAGIDLDDLGLVEINEAFASQAVAVVRELDLDESLVNVNGGAIALGHPLGASGARILTTLVHEMQRREVRYGLATMCIGVGQGISLVVERA